MGRKMNKFTLEEEKTNKKNKRMGQAKSEKIFTYLPELNLTQKNVPPESITERERKGFDPVSMAMKYKKKRF